MSAAKIIRQKIAKLQKSCPKHQKTFVTYTFIIPSMQIKSVTILLLLTLSSLALCADSDVPAVQSMTDEEAVNKPQPLANVCYHQPTSCTNIANCNLQCTAYLSEIVAQQATVQGIWTTLVNGFAGDFGGPWTVFQTGGATWYSNWGTAASCGCAGTGIFTVVVQQ